MASPRRRHKTKAAPGPSPSTPPSAPIAEAPSERVPFAKAKPAAYNPRTDLNPGDPEYDTLEREMSAQGFLGGMVWNRRTGNLVAGHQRVKILRAHGWTAAPMAVVDLDARQEKILNLALNRVGGSWDHEALRAVLAEIREDPAILQTGFDDATIAGIVDEGLRLTESLAAAAGETRPGLTDPDAVPEPPARPSTRRGDLYLLGEHRLLCGDSARPADCDRLTEGRPVHLVNTDPPYNVRVEPRSNNAIAAGLSSFPPTAKTRPATGQGRLTHHQGLDLARFPAKKNPTTRKLRAKDRPLQNDFLPAEAFDAALAAWFGEMARALQPGGTFYVWGGYANLANYPAPLRAAGLYFAQAIIWIKEHPVLTRKDFMGNHEWAFYGWREGAAHRFFGEANVPDTWRIRRAPGTASPAAYALGRGVRVQAGPAAIDVMAPAPNRNLRPVEADARGEALLTGPTGPADVWEVKKVNPQAMVHLTEKPVELATRAMHYSSLAGERVLDLFGGSGSTLIAAEQTGRRALLMELDPAYADVIVSRWEQFTGRKAQRQRSKP